MRLIATLGFSAVVASIGAVYYVHQRSVRTGDGYLATLRQLPAQARSLVDDVARRGRLAAQEGLQAARMREEEVTRQLDQAEPREAIT